MKIIIIIKKTRAIHVLLRQISLSSCRARLCFFFVFHLHFPLAKAARALYAPAGICATKTSSFPLGIFTHHFTLELRVRKLYHRERESERASNNFTQRLHSLLYCCFFLLFVTREYFLQNQLFHRQIFCCC